MTFWDGFLLAWPIVWPMAASLFVLLLTMVLMGFVFYLLFQKILPVKLYDFFLKVVCLFGFFLWIIPMQMGFYEYFK